MNRKFQKAGAVASVAVMFAMFLGTGLTGAFAQDQAEPSELEMANEEAPMVAAEAQPQVRFVSNAVIQEVPEEQAAPQLPAPSAESLRALVNTMPAAGELSAEMQCLAQAVYFESRGEPLAGQLAVAHVVINRAESSLFPDDYCSVVTQRAQFSFVRGGRIPAPNAASQAWHRARKIARIAHQDMWSSEAEEALYFHATHVSPRWARRMNTVARIDSHIFYR